MHLELILYKLHTCDSRHGTDLISKNSGKIRSHKGLSLYACGPPVFLASPEARVRLIPGYRFSVFL